MHMNPTASIIIPCRNERDHIESTLTSILAQDPPAGGFEVLVADGMSDDGTREVLQRLSRQDPRLRVLDNPDLIVSAALNAAIRHARGSVIVRMDAHTRYAGNYVRRCVDALHATGADSVGGPWVATGSGLIGRAIAAAFVSPFSCGGARGHDRDHEGAVDTVYLGCWRRDLFDRIGLFDEELVRNQDDEFSLRLTHAGGRIWQSRSIESWYMARGSLGALFRQYLQYGYWKVRVIQKHRMPASVRHVVPAAFVVSLIALALASAISPAAAPILSALIVVYLLCTAIASCATAARSGWTLLPVLPLVFVCYHVAYGVGFLHGVIDFAILRRTRTGRHAALTRARTRSSVQTIMSDEPYSR
jgi:succinoglycan biosynthesis protein ExoA